ncbi:unnamed protein product [Closterium sp. NIES-65]|nr:unnamed protein product [Closterium sp. NIES-65]
MARTPGMGMEGDEGSGVFCQSNLVTATHIAATPRSTSPSIPHTYLGGPIPFPTSLPASLDAHAVLLAIGPCNGAPPVPSPYAYPSASTPPHAPPAIPVWPRPLAPVLCCWQSHPRTLSTTPNRNLSQRHFTCPPTYCPLSPSPPVFPRPLAPVLSLLTVASRYPQRPEYPGAKSYLSGRVPWRTCCAAGNPVPRGKPRMSLRGNGEGRRGERRKGMVARVRDTAGQGHGRSGTRQVRDTAGQGHGRSGTRQVRDTAGQGHGRSGTRQDAQRVAQDEQGVAQDEQGVAQDEQGVGQEEQGVGQEEQGVGQEEQGVGQEEQGVGQEEQGVGQEEQGVGQEEQGVGQEEQGVGQEEQGVGQEEQGVGQEEQGVGQEEQGVGQEEQGVGQEEQGVGQEEQGVGQEEQGVGQEEQGVGQEEQGVGQEEQGVGQEEQGVGQLSSGDMGGRKAERRRGGNEGRRERNKGGGREREAHLPQSLA